MRLWIDATRPESWSRIFGMPLVERHLRAISVAFGGVKKIQNAERKVGRTLVGGASASSRIESRVRPSEIWLELPADAPETDWIPKGFRKWPIREMRSSDSTGRRLQRAIEAANGEEVVALSGDSVLDQRVIANLMLWPGESVACMSEEGPNSAAVMRLTGPLPDTVMDESNLLAIAKAAIKGAHVEQLRVEDMATFINKLRRDLVPYLIRITDEATRARVERFLFDSNYKGATDFMTKYAYPPIVWRLTKRWADRRVDPSRVTVVGILSCIASIPFFAAGLWIPGLVLAYTMSVLDSVDGKLARTTFRSTGKGNVLDHGTDTVHPPFWYGAWGWGLGGGDPYSPAFQAALWMTGFYIFDRLLERIFKAATNYSIHSYRPLDVRMRTVVARRNVNLVVLTVALPFGLGVESMFLMAAWQGLTALFHLSRVIKFWNVVNDAEAMYAATE
jgi:phosphatidylglycerophosphate synthase